MATGRAGGRGPRRRSAGGGRGDGTGRGGQDAVTGQPRGKRTVGVSVRHGLVDVVVTASTIFFCLPIAGDGFEGSGWDARDEAERDEVRRYVAWLSRGNTAKTDRFPSFGAYDSAQLDPSLVAEVHEDLGHGEAPLDVPSAVVAATLPTMVSIVHRRLAEQYLIHDAWGHGWQEALCDFEWPYRLLPHLSDPLHAAPAPFAREEGPRLADAFGARDGSTVLHRDALLAFAELDARGRVEVGISGVLSELLADLVEWKFVSQRQPTDDDFPSSSLLRGRPVKLDLLVNDVRHHLRWWRRPYLELRDHPEVRARLVMELAELGRLEAGLVEAVDEAAIVMATHLAPLFDDRLAAGLADAPGASSASFLDRFLLNAVSFAREIEVLLAAERDAQEGDVWLRPEASVDLVVLLLGWLYERDRSRMMWHLDEMARHVIAPRLARLQAALRSGR